MWFKNQQAWMFWFNPSNLFMWRIFVLNWNVSSPWKLVKGWYSFFTFNFVVLSLLFEYNFSILSLYPFLVHRDLCLSFWDQVWRILIQKELKSIIASPKFTATFGTFSRCESYVQRFFEKMFEYRLRFSYFLLNLHFKYSLLLVSMINFIDSLFI